MAAKFYRHFEQLVNAIFKTNHPWRKRSPCHYCIEISTQCQAWKNPKIYTLDSTCASQVFRNESKLNLGKGKILEWLKHISLQMDRKYCAHLNSCFMNCKIILKCGVVISEGIFNFVPSSKRKNQIPARSLKFYFRLKSWWKVIWFVYSRMGTKIKKYLLRKSHLYQVRFINIYNPVILYSTYFWCFYALCQKQWSR